MYNSIITAYKQNEKKNQTKKNLKVKVHFAEKETNYHTMQIFYGRNMFWPSVSWYLLQARVRGLHKSPCSSLHGAGSLHLKHIWFCLGGHMLSLEGRDTRSTSSGGLVFSLISSRPGLCDLRSVIQTEAVPLTKQ